MMLITAQTETWHTQDPKVEQETPRLWLFPKGNLDLTFFF